MNDQRMVEVLKTIDGQINGTIRALENKEPQIDRHVVERFCLLLDLEPWNSDEIWSKVLKALTKEA